MYSKKQQEDYLQYLKKKVEQSQRNIQDSKISNPPVDTDGNPVVGIVQTTDATVGFPKITDKPDIQLDNDKIGALALYNLQKIASQDIATYVWDRLTLDMMESFNTSLIPLSEELKKYNIQSKDGLLQFIVNYLQKKQYTIPSFKSKLNKPPLVPTTPSSNKSYTPYAYASLGSYAFLPDSNTPSVSSLGLNTPSSYKSSTGPYKPQFVSIGSEEESKIFNKMLKENPPKIYTPNNAHLSNPNLIRPIPLSPDMDLQDALDKIYKHSAYLSTSPIPPMHARLNQSTFNKLSDEDKMNQIIYEQIKIQNDIQNEPQLQTYIISFPFENNTQHEIADDNFSIHQLAEEETNVILLATKGETVAKTRKNIKEVLGINFSVKKSENKAMMKKLLMDHFKNEIQSQIGAQQQSNISTASITGIGFKKVKKPKRPYKTRYRHIVGGGAQQNASNVTKNLQKYNYFKNDLYLIDLDKLNRNIINVKYEKNSKVVEALRNKNISKDCADCIRNIIDDKFNNKEYMLLSPNEKSIVKILIKRCKFVNAKINDPEDDAFQKRFEILRGEYLAGQDNPQVLKELRQYVLIAQQEGQISKKEATELLLQLSSQLLDVKK